MAKATVPSKGKRLFNQDCKIHSGKLFMFSEDDYLFIYDIAANKWEQTIYF
jgi:hypothetical protein